MESECVVVNIPSVGIKSFCGIASAYSTDFPSEMQGLLTKREFTLMMERLNDEILSFWPCGYCFFLNFARVLMMYPVQAIAHKCIDLSSFSMMESENRARELIQQYNLKASLYDNNIRVMLKKSGFYDSWLEFHFPITYVNKMRAEHIDLESGMRCVTVPGRYQEEQRLAALACGSDSYRTMPIHASEMSGAQVINSTPNTSSDGGVSADYECLLTEEGNHRAD